MRNSKEVFEEIVMQLAETQPVDEATAVARMLMRRFFALEHADVMRPSPVPTNEVSLEKLNNAIVRLHAGEPVQYVLEEAHFCGHDFFVDHRVLIPRPETEEMVMMILGVLRKKKADKPLRIIDIGTGSGCIPISIAVECRNATVMATDISEGALQVAQMNAANLDANVNFIQHDILRELLPFSDIDILVSNPPYIAESEVTAMERNVVSFEPHSALFVPDDDPLIFYKAIAREGKRVLNSGGMIFAEINQRYGAEVRRIWEDAGLVNVHVLKDLSGNDRFVEGFQL